jgi:cytochrome c oxidase assembly factor 2
MTTSLFTTTLMVSFLVVAAPHVLPCPVDPRTLADSPDPTGNRRRRRRKSTEEETCNDVMSEERLRRKQLEDKLAPKRECPVPKPGGLIGQVLGWKGEKGDADPATITSRVERARRDAQSKNDQ